MIDWSKYFDKIWCINYIPYANRKNAVQKEFDRIGISQHHNFQWNLTYSSPWHDFMLQALREKNKCNLLNVNELKCALGHYDCIKRSVLDNNSFALIIEDDSRFLKDINKIQKILDDIPENADIVMFDYFVLDKSKYDYDILNRKVNDNFCYFDSLNSTGCYALSNKALKTFCNLYEQFLIPSDNYISKIQYKDLVKVFSIKNISCQATYSKSMSFHNGGNMTIHNVYRKVDLNYHEYMMRGDQQSYTYGDFIYE